MIDRVTIADGLKVGLKPIETLLKAKSIEGVPEEHVMKVLNALIETDCEVYSWDNGGNFDINFFDITK